MKKTGLTLLLAAFALATTSNAQENKKEFTTDCGGCGTTKHHAHTTAKHHTTSHVKYVTQEEFDAYKEEEEVINDNQDKRLDGHDEAFKAVLTGFHDLHQEIVEVSNKQQQPSVVNNFNPTNNTTVDYPNQIPLDQYPQHRIDAQGTLYGCQNVTDLGTPIGNIDGANISAGTYLRFGGGQCATYQEGTGQRLSTGTCQQGRPPIGNQGQGYTYHQAQGAQYHQGNGSGYSQQNHQPHQQDHQPHQQGGHQQHDRGRARGAGRGGE